MKLMQANNDDKPCALLFRKRPGDAWEHHCYTLSISVAWRTADMLFNAWKDDGVKDIQVVVMLRELYDEACGTPLVPPLGFEHLGLNEQETRQGQDTPPLVDVKTTHDVEASEETGLGAIDTDMDF